MNVFIKVLGEPVGKGRPRFSTKGGFPRAYTPAKTESYQKSIKAEYLENYIPLLFAPNTPLLIIVNAFMPIPKSTSKKNRISMLEGHIRPMKKPDADNILKAAMDALNGVAYEDDKQFVSTTCNKWYSEVPRTEIIIEEI